MKNQNQNQKDDKNQKSLTSIYLNDIRKKDLLSHREEITLSKIIKNSDSEKEVQDAKNNFILANLRLVVNIAKKYNAKNLEMADLIEEGNLGLIRAVEKYDGESGFRFATYATRWIQQFIETAIMNHSRTVRLPIHISKSMRKIESENRKLKTELGRSPNEKELSKATQFSIEKIQKISNIKDKTSSLDSSIREELGDSFISLIADDNKYTPYVSIENENTKKSIEFNLLKLKKREMDIISKRFGLLGKEESSLEDIAKSIGLTRERVRQLQLIGLKRMKSLLNENDINLEQSF
jgi:RNA polymerase nonessential primary-like sigma factor